MIFASLTLLSLLVSSTMAAPADMTERKEELSQRSYLWPSLFPAGQGSSSGTASTSLSPFTPVKSFLPVTKGKLPTLGKAPDGKGALVGHFPQGSLQLTNGGFSFYSPSAVSGIEWAREITFGYSVYFQEGFNFNLGGKLLGVYGGSTQDLAYSCSGGRQSNRDDCFSLRMMWRQDGKGELYNYLPTSVVQPDSYNNYPPYSDNNPVYGDSIGRGSFYFASGGWTTVTQRIKLNDIGSENGEIELYVNGISTIYLTGLTLRTKSEVVFRGIMAQTFFGGSSESYASPQDQYCWFKDFTVAILDWF